MRTNKGFSLMELLTVIAIIAILSAIIFPVMNTVRAQAKKQQCITQLHDIAIRADIYKRDNRTYPDVLGPIAAAGVRMESARPTAAGSLFARGYIDNPKVFHCPLDLNDDSLSAVVYHNGTTDNNVYVWSSYDLYAKASGPNACRYMVRWAAWPSGGSFTPIVSGLAPYPPGTTDTPALQEQDYARQLIFRNPPSDTVLTWCSNHATDPEGVNPGGMAIVVYIDGHTETQPADVVFNSRWRVHPKK